MLKKNNLPFFFSFLLLFLSATIVFSQSKSQIQFQTETYDFGRFATGNQLSYDFEFINLGPSKLFIEDIKTSCGCTLVEYPKDSLSVGEKGIITLNFNSEGRTGKFAKSIIVYSNAVEVVKVLYITGEIEEETTTTNNKLYQSGNIAYGSGGFEQKMFLSPLESTFLRE